MQRGILVRASAVGLVACACGAPDADSPVGVVNGGGPILHASTSLAWLDPVARTFASLRVGLRAVEIVRLRDAPEKLTVEASIVRTGCDSFPIALAAVDVDGDGQREVVVSDPGCGNWAAHATPSGWLTSPAEDVLPAIPPAPTLGSLQPCGAAEACLIAASSYGFDLLALHEGVWRAETVFASTKLADFTQVAPLGSIFERSDGSIGVVHSRAGALAEFDFCATCDRMLSSPEKLTLVGHELSLGLDNFIALGDPVLAGLGVQVFPPAAGAVPRRLATLRHMAGDLELISSEDLAPSTFVAWTQEARATAAIVALSGDGSRVFVAAASPDGVRVLTELETGWGFRPLDSTPDYTLVQPSLDGAQLLVTPDTAPTRHMIAYDGFALLHVALAHDLSSVDVSTEEVHHERPEQIW